VVESAVRSWGLSYGLTMRRWAGAARKVLECDEAWRDAGDSYQIVRYEDLVSDLEGSLRSLFDRCHLDPRLYDFEAAAALPVRGSSRHLSPTGRPHWQPVTRPPDFAAQETWRSWSAPLLEEFQLVAADVSSRLGYESGPVPGLAARARLHRALNDLRWRRRTRRGAARTRGR
jgi:hypothetical protein